MDFLKRAIQRGISEGVGSAVGSAIEKAVAPKAEQLADEAARQIDRAAQAAAPQATQAAQAAGGLSNALAGLQRAAEGYATEISKNVKLCPACGQPADASEKFCPACGAQLPEETVAQGAVCPACGKQNTVGTKFCTGCGAKLPAAIQEEKAAQARDAQLLAEWDEKLPAYPKWNGGGTNYTLESFENGLYFSVCFASEPAAQAAVCEYRALLQQHGFHPAGQYPSTLNLYNKVDGVCYGADTEHAFDGGIECTTIAFMQGEPTGGYDYVKPAPKKSGSIFDLFK